MYAHYQTDNVSNTNNRGALCSAVIPTKTESSVYRSYDAPAQRLPYPTRKDGLGVCVDYGKRR
jgi:hypothetical protein